MAAPMPLDAPVTTATFPESFLVVFMRLFFRFVDWFIFSSTGPIKVKFGSRLIYPQMAQPRWRRLQKSLLQKAERTNLNDLSKVTSFRPSRSSALRLMQRSRFGVVICRKLRRSGRAGARRSDFSVWACWAGGRNTFGVLGTVPA